MDNARCSLDLSNPVFFAPPGRLSPLKTQRTKFSRHFHAVYAALSNMLPLFFARGLEPVTAFFALTTPILPTPFYFDRSCDQLAGLPPAHIRKRRPLVLSSFASSFFSQDLPPLCEFVEFHARGHCDPRDDREPVRRPLGHSFSLER